MRQAPDSKLKRMSATSVSIPPRQWFGIGLAAIVPGQVLWFAMLFPLVPKGGAGWALAAGLGALATIWAVASVAALLWLNGRKQHRFLSNALGLVVAVQLGVGIFAIALDHQDLLASHFSYFGR